MKVLLSAYACEPNKGSEPGVGWNWALETARLGHDVWVLTRANNREVIEAELSKSHPIDNLKFLYYDLPTWARWWKKGSRGVYLYYLLWQWGAYRLARRIHRREPFDRVHHVTFVNIRQPSFMGKLDIPFIFGPVAGGEKAPWHLRIGYGWRGWIMDFIRDLGNQLIRIDPMVRRAFKQAELIYATSEQTYSLLPLKYRPKASVQLAIGFNSDEMPNLPDQYSSYPKNQGNFRILYIGQLLYWKGMHLGLPAFARLLKKMPDAQLTIVGKGPDAGRWRAMAVNLGVEDRIDWIPWLDRKQLPLVYASHNAFLFPSLHDSGGIVVMEAMAHGLPVICLDLGGPGQIIDNDCGRVISTAGQSESQVSSALAQALIQCAGDKNLRRQLGTEAMLRVKELSWSSVVAPIYKN